MAIYRGPGGSGDAVNDSSSETRLAVEARDAAIAAQAAAEAAQVAAELAETNAETAETNAETAETNAETAATNAASSASAASTSASNASSSASSASTSATNAASSASAASSSASAASTSATNAATSATNAANSATAAATSATNASNSATAAASSASSASSSASTATTQASNASTSATNAASSATSAASSASTATTQAGLASTSATNAANSASAASTSATNASNSASAASTSASNAATSATAAQTAETNAETAQAAAEAARDAALSAYDNFDDRYLGPKASDPTLDNDGNALISGALYFNTTTNVMKVYTGSAWVAAYVSSAGVLLTANNLSDVASVSSARTNLGVTATGADTAYAYRANNLSDLASASTARTNLGLGTAATTAATDYATAAQGAKADTALQPATIGVSVQAYDANTAKLNAAQSWSAAQSFNAGVTLGDASGDALTINSSAVSIPNGLNFDSNTFVVDATNNRVGVGTASPSATLSVTTSTMTNQIIADSMSDSTTYGLISLNASRTSTSYLGIAGGGGTDKTLFLNVPSTGKYSFRNNFSEQMVLDSSGNLGLGTSSPTGKLEVYGANGSGATTLNVTGGASAGDYGILGIRNGTTTRGRLVGDATVDALRIDTAGGTSTSINFLTGSSYSERMRIDSSGNVGIGTSSPAAKLDVRGQTLVDNITASTAKNLSTWNVNGANYAQLYDIGTTANVLALGGSPVVTTVPSTPIMAWDLDNANVGIGTSSINATYSPRLHVESSANDGTGGLLIGNYLPTLTLFDYSGGAGASQIQQDGTNFLIKNGGSTRATLDSSGNLGLGVTPSAWSSGKAFEIGNVGDGLSINYGYGLVLNRNSYYNAGFKYSSSDYASQYRQSGGQHQWMVAPSGTAGNAITFTQAMTLDASGNLQVGNPSTTANRRIAVAGTYPIISSQNGTVETVIWANTDHGRIGNLSNHDVRFVVNDSERMRIDSSGNVGIGTSSPVRKLHVSGGDAQIDYAYNSSGTSFRILNDATPSNGINLVAEFYGTGSYGPIKFTTSNTERFRIGASGQLGIGGANYGTSGQALVSNGSGSAPSWQTVSGGQYFGTAATKAIAYNSNTISENITVTAGNNGLSAGPVTVSTGYTVTVETGANWVIV